MAIKTNNEDALTITRWFDAPRELAWKAWTEPERMKTWWGPRYFTAPVIKSDFRVGGKYLFCMRGPDGKEYWSTGDYREIVPPERLVMTDHFADEKGNIVPASHYGMMGEFPLELLVTVTFEAIGGKTKMVLRHEGVPEGLIKEMTKAGWSTSFDKLVEHIVPVDRTRILAEPGKQEILVTRIIDAPREQIFQAYTDPDLVPRFWGPSRLTTVIDKLDARPGGSWRFVQYDAADRKYAFHGVYHEVLSAERIVNTFEYEGTPGKVSLDTYLFENAGGKTKITSRSVFQTTEDRDGMMEEGSEEGVLETMDRLAALLERARAEKKAA